MERFPNTEQSYEKKEVLPGFVEPAFRRAEQVLKSAEVNIDNFVEQYGPEKIESAKQYVKEREAGFQERRERDQRNAEFQKLGTILEALLHEQITDHQLFGEHSHGMKTSRFDDIKHGVDEMVLLERPEGSAFVGLSVDFTFTDPREKLNRIIEGARLGKLAKVEYVSINTDRVSIKGEMEVPRVVIGIDREHVLDLVRVWESEDQATLATHPVRMLILQQIADQLDIIGGIADPQIKNRYTVAKRHLEELIATKKRDGESMGEMRKDGVYKLIRERLTEILNKNSEPKTQRPRFLGRRN